MIDPPWVQCLVALPHHQAAGAGCGLAITCMRSVPVMTLVSAVKRGPEISPKAQSLPQKLVMHSNISGSYQ